MAPAKKAPNFNRSIIMLKKKFVVEIHNISPAFYNEFKPFSVMWGYTYTKNVNPFSGHVEYFNTLEEAEKFAIMKKLEE